MWILFAFKLPREEISKHCLKFQISSTHESEKKEKEKTSFSIYIMGHLKCALYSMTSQNSVNNK